MTAGGFLLSFEEHCPSCQSGNAEQCLQRTACHRQRYRRRRIYESEAR